MSRTRWIVLVAAIAIGGTLAGQPQLGGLVAAVVFLVFVIAVAVGADSGRTKSGRKARSINYLARYSDPSADVSLGGAVVASFAGWAIVDVTMPGAELSALAGSLLLPALLFLLQPELGAACLAIGGVVCTVITLFRDDVCRPQASHVSFGMIAAVLGVFGAVNLAAIGATALFSSLPKFLPTRLPSGDRILLLFALLDLALFVARPNGLEVWQDAPGWAMPAALGLVGVIAVFGSYAARFVLGLLALAIVLAQGTLAMVEHGLMSGTPTECGDPLKALLWAGAAFVLITIGVTIRSPMSTRGLVSKLRV
jgi:hypothetical protein